MESFCGWHLWRSIPLQILTETIPCGVLACRLPQLCAQLGLPAGELLTQQGPHLLLSVALLAAPSALTWVFQQASAAALKYTSSSNSGSSSGTTGALATTPGRQSEVAVGASTTGEGGPWLKMSYAVLPLVWAGEQDPVAHRAVQCSAELLAR
jgi:hypothetical protein